MVNKILRLPDAQERVGLSKAQIYALMKAGKFPRALQLSERAVGWLDSDIQNWIEERHRAQ